MIVLFNSNAAIVFPAQVKMEAGGRRMKTLLLTILLATVVQAQSADTQTPAASGDKAAKKKAKRSPGGDIGSGAGNVGTGAAKGAGNLAKGAAKGAADLATLHPIDGAPAIGGGALSAGKDVTVGTAKGAGKITKGVGRVFKKIL
jgi:hypothetical protein